MVKLVNLGKDYRDLVALDNVSFELEKGDVLAFVGSNGAGKSTTLKILSTLISPTRGTAKVDGFDVTQNPEAIRNRIGYMPDFFGVYEHLRVHTYLEFFARLYGVPRPNQPRVIADALELTNLTEKTDEWINALSRGMQQRLSLARCLLHDPKLLLLDEPASGLDPRARVELKDLILNLSRMGKTVIISSHILPDLEDFCNKVAILERGKLVAFGEVEAILKGLNKSTVLRIEFIGNGQTVQEILDLSGNVVGHERIGLNTIVAEFSGSLDDQAELLKALVTSGTQVTAFHIEKKDLQTAFFQLTTGEVN